VHGADVGRLETVDLDGLGIKTEALLLVTQEFLDILSLITLKLDDFTHFGVAHDGAIASKGLLDDLENLLLVELLGESLNSGQGLASIALLDTDVNVAALVRLLYLSGVFIGFGEGVEGLEVFDRGGHKTQLLFSFPGKGWIKKGMCWFGLSGERLAGDSRVLY